MPGPRILFIDPDESSSAYLAQEFKQKGFEVYTALNGKEGMITAWRYRPHVIVIDPVLTDISIEEFLDKIRRDKRTGKTKLLALSSLVHPNEIQAAIALGFDRYLAKELDVIPVLKENIKLLLEDLERARTAKEQRKTQEQQEEGPEPIWEETPETEAPEPMVETPQGVHLGKLVVFLSAKGGTGTSSICANMAHMFATQHPTDKCAVIDMVLPIGSIAPIVGYEGELNIVEVSLLSTGEASPQYMRDALPRIENWDFNLLAGAADPDEASELDVPRIPVMINAIRQSYDWVFVDLGRSLSRISLPIIASADQVILILSLDEATVTLTLTVLDFLRNKGLKRSQVYPLINRAVGLEGLPKREVDEMLGIEITGNIPHIGGTFSMSNNAHMPVALRFPDNVVVVALREIVEKLTRRMKVNETIQSSAQDSDN